MLVKKYGKCLFWKLNNHIWRCNYVSSWRPLGTCTQSNIGLRTFWIVITKQNAGCKILNNDQDFFYKLNIKWYNMFWNFVLNIVDFWSLCYCCYIQTFQVWLKMALLNLNLFQPPGVFCEKIRWSPFNKNRKTQ